MAYEIEERKIKFDKPPAKGTEVNLKVSTQQSLNGFADPRSFYPRRVNEVDTNRLAVNDATKQHPVVNLKRQRVDDLVGEPETQYASKYPYNHVHQSESGHIIEIDDTPGFERLHRYHRAGTFEEIGALGQRITKVMNEDQTFKMMNSFEKIFGDSLISIDGDLDIVSERGYTHSTGSFSLDSKSAIRMSGLGQGLFSARGGIVVDSGSGSLSLRGQNLIHDFKDSSQTQKIRGNLVNKVGGKFSTRASGINLGSRGATSVSSGGSYNVITGDNINEASTNLAGIFGAPARSFKSAIGEIIFETALPGPTGSFAFNAGISGLLGSISMDQLGQISLNVGPGGSIAKLTLGATGIELSYLAGLAKIELNAAGVSINGLTSSMTGTVQAKVDGALVNVEASGINTVKGSLVTVSYTHLTLPTKA